MLQVERILLLELRDADSLSHIPQSIAAPKDLMLVNPADPAPSEHQTVDAKLKKRDDHRFSASVASVMLHMSTATILVTVIRRLTS